MAKRKRKRTKSIKNPRSLPRARPRQDEPKIVQFIEYEITTDPMEEPRYKKLPQHVKAAFEQLYFEAQKNPEKAIPKLLAWLEKYPNIPMLYNYLSVAYNMSGQQDKAEEVILKNYRRNPDYLFARLNYAEVQRSKGNYDKVAEIFDNKFDLKLLYPHRNRFHISEVVNFAGVMGLYFLDIGQRDVAEKYYELLKQLDPDHQNTRILGYRLYPTPLQKIFRRLTSKSKKGKS